MSSPQRSSSRRAGGATTKKVIYKVPYHYAYPLGNLAGEVRRVADQIVDRNGHILPYVRFEGGHLHLAKDALDVLDRAQAAKS